ncbi:RHS repeat protein [Dyella kyungheensis]|uniref:RHS repeat protein n=1 Tax=Dyella kyungheensis TaxID=1242174 RepID=A0ABS2JSZ3_9GAMM|nr:RHS repeat protein [Dyella kyungheensis]MBM7122136.1 RHS repeat protein [Dyella kyungheensis]
MKRAFVAGGLLCLLGSVFAGHAIAAGAATVEPYQEYAKLIRVSEQVEPLTSDLFGESVNLYNGQTEFSNVDIDIPGNGGLPVQLRRRFSVVPLPANAAGIEPFGGFGNWDADVPYISGVFDAWYGWEKGSLGIVAARCSSAFMPATSSPLRLKDVFSGVSVHVPGRGDREVMQLSSSLYPTDGVTHLWTTREMDAFTCTPGTKNGYPGEGFVMRTSEEVTYTFDVGVTRNPGAVEASGTTRPRVKVYLLASRIEDRFGNWVSYSYDGSGKPLSITASDGRNITLTYTNGVITSAQVNDKQWTYQYQTYGTGGETQQRLSIVHLPDNSAWSYAYDADLKVYYSGWDGNTGRNCADQAPVATGNFTLHITHPSGALGDFGFVMQRHYRDGVSVRNCLTDMSGTEFSYHLGVSNYYDIYSLDSKVVSGAGIAAPMRWSYHYSDDVYSLISGTEPCSSCASTKTVEVTQPDGSRLAYRFGAVFAVNDGRLLGADTFSADGTKLRSETREYITTADMANQPFPSIYGILIGADDPAAGQIRPQKSIAITQNGDTFTHRVEAFNEWAQPTQVRRFSSLAGQQAFVENTSYVNDRTRWMLGLIERKTNGVTGEIIARSVYDSVTLLPVQRLEFERLTMGLGYNAQGLLTNVSDGNSRVTTLGNYKRGIPQLISYADNTSQSVVVNDDGKITQVTDQAASTTHYDYDAVGRLTSVIYPTGDAVTWTPKSTIYDFVTTAERGIGGGHWRRTVAKGDSRDVTYFDVMLRPILRDIYMASAPSSHVSSRTDFDWRGKKTFESYPGSGALDLASLGQGTFAAFDALGRPIRNWQDSELGQVVTATAYLPGGVRRFTGARGGVTDSYFQMFDQPSYETIVSVQAPEGVSQYIERDIYGNAMSITQGGSDGSLNRTLVYDAQKRLCRVSEPETGDRVMDYDGANNLWWSASGVLITGTGCGREQVAAAARTTRGYDEKNRLQSVQYPAGTESLAFTYTERGEPKTAVSGATRWTFGHNKLGLLTSETLAIDGFEWAIGYTFDANANLSSARYPDGRQVDYAPDALGRPTQVGSYAGSISYFPDGDVQAYVLGNGGQYLAQKNARGLVANFSYAKGGVLAISEDYTYDASANITSINDLAGGPRSRSMSYDGLNRLQSANALQLWGAESFSYDTLNNIRSMTLNGSVKTWRYSANNLLTSVTSGAETLQSFGYDNRGNTTNKNGVALTFDQADRLTSIQGYANYNYDAAGRRVKKRNGSNASVYYAYGRSGQLMFEFDPASAKTTDYFYLGKKLIAYSGLPTTRIAGQVEGVVVADPLASLKGWACLAGSNASIQVQLYVGSETGTYLGAYTANAASDSNIALRCRATGTAYRFDIALTDAMRIQYAAQALYVHGVSTSGDKALLAGSGAFQVPAWVLAPSPPARLDTVLAGDLSSLNVSWPSSLGATSYQLEQSFNGDGFTAVLNSSATSWSRNQPGDGRYAYRVRACSDKGCSAWTNSSTITVAHPPATPSSIQAPSSSSGNFTVQWASAAYATSYTLEQSANGGSWSAVYSGSLTQYAASVTATGSYGYRVKSCNATACSGYVTSNSVAVTIPPNAASSVAVSNGSLTGSYTVSWTGVSGASTYTLQEQVNGGGWSTVRADGVTNWSTSGRSAATYGYRVQACNAGGCGPWSATASLTVTLKPAIPSILGPADEVTVKRPNVGFTIVWSSSQGANNYQYEVVGYTSGTVTGTSVNIPLINAGAYAYRVRACGAGGSCSDWNERWVTVHVQGEVDP